MWVEQKYGQSPDFYVKSALQIALKLTEFILEADEEERVGQGGMPYLLIVLLPKMILMRVRRIEGGGDMIDFA